MYFMPTLFKQNKRYVARLERRRFWVHFDFHGELIAFFSIASAASCCYIVPYCFSTSGHWFYMLSCQFFVFFKFALMPVAVLACIVVSCKQYSVCYYPSDPSWYLHIFYQPYNHGIRIFFVDCV